MTHAPIAHETLNILVRHVVKREVSMAVIDSMMNPTARLSCQGISCQPVA